jgi:hypothetical protein
MVCTHCGVHEIQDRPRNVAAHKKTINIDVRSIGNRAAIRGGMKRRERAFRHQTCVAFQGQAHCKRVQRAPLAAGGGSEIAARRATGLIHHGSSHRRGFIGLGVMGRRVDASVPQDQPDLLERNSMAQHLGRRRVSQDVRPLEAFTRRLTLACGAMSRPFDRSGMATASRRW